jgi:acyl-CoA dehydrogenase
MDAQSAILRVAPALRAHAGQVDQEGRFPREAWEALRGEALLSASIPRYLGGWGLPVAEVAAICLALGKECASTAMIFAMHQIQLISLVGHGLGQNRIAEFVGRAATDQLLIASGTSEAGGGDIRTSTAALEPDGEGLLRLRKHISTASYGLQADAFLVTARRSPSAEPSDQVLALIDRTRADAVEWSKIEADRHWNALGMRGTVSAGARLEARTSAETVLRAPFADILARTMLPVSHVLWSAVWLGIAAGALELAGRHLRGRHRGTGSRVPQAYTDKVSAFYELHAFHRHLAMSLSAGGAGMSRATLRELVEFNSLKVRVSTGVVQIIIGAMSAVGLAAYLLDSDVALDRYLRDALSAPVMIRNDRLVDTVSQTLTVMKSLL